MDSMVERVARAICEEGGYGDYGAAAELYESLSRAAINAMVEPTPEMVEAAKTALPDDAYILAPYKIMLAAALSDTEGR